MRTPLVLGNWKMNLGARQAIGLARDLKRAVAAGGSRATVGVCPSPVHVASVREGLEGSSIQVGSQDLVAQEPGAFTGGTSAEQLRELGVTFTLIGHSERRHVFGETDQDVVAKVAAAHRASLLPVVCYGETLDQREAGRTRDVVLGQVEAALAGLSAAQVSALVLAYEPVWAIGTGRNAEVADAVDVHRTTRAWVSDRFGPEAAAAVRIVYGGSVKPDNASGYLAETEIDGALVGGASLQADSFLGILGAA